jgi:lipoprotein NlpI
MADFDKAIQLNPKYAAAYYNRGVLHYFGKRPQQAIDDLDMTLHFDSSFEKAYFARALGV